MNALRAMLALVIGVAAALILLSGWPFIAEMSEHIGSPMDATGLAGSSEDAGEQPALFENISWVWASVILLLITVFTFGFWIAELTKG